MRLDVALVTRGLAPSRNQAAAAVARGEVRVAGVVAAKASMQVGDGDEITSEAERWVSRAARKLIGALDESGVDVHGRVLDAGASTGGFTQVCLERGAECVYAVDVGHGQLDAQLREDPRVVVREGLNLRDLTLDDLDGEAVDLIVGDVSFISLALLLEPLFAVCRGQALLLVKPQFEVGRARLGAGGVVESERDRREAVAGIRTQAERRGWETTWEGVSSLPGSAGNIEHFLCFRAPSEGPR